MLTCCLSCAKSDRCEQADRVEDFCLNYEERPMTNYDRLISKTPEELAKWLDDNDSNFPISDGGEQWLSWLKSPAEEVE